MKVDKQGTVHFFDLPDIPYIQVIYGANVSNEFSRHVHSGFIIGIVLKGGRVINRYGTSTIIPENGMFVVNPGEPHSCKSHSQRHSYLTICVNVEGMNAVAAQVSEKARALPHFTNVLLYDAELSFKIQQFFSLVENAGSAIERESALLSFLSTLILRYGNNPPEPCRISPHIDAINNACEYIKTHYAQNMTLKQLAGMACLSPFYFQRLFLENTGISPHDYLIQFRIKKAREFFAEGQNITGVALDTGFVDQSHFSRSFKQATGTTPGHYLQAMKTRHCKKAEPVINQICC
jgi:AraC-like DNA-binding protein